MQLERLERRRLLSGVASTGSPFLAAALSPAAGTQFASASLPNGDTLLFYPAAGEGQAIIMKAVVHANTVVDTPVPVASGSAKNLTPIVAATNASGQSVIAWIANNGSSGDDIVAVRVSADGTVSEPFIVNSDLSNTAQANPALSMESDGSFVAAFTGAKQEGQDSAYITGFSGTGERLFNDTLVTKPSSNTDTKTATVKSLTVSYTQAGVSYVAWEHRDADGNGHFTEQGIISRAFDTTGTLLVSSVNVLTDNHSYYQLNTASFVQGQVLPILVYSIDKFDSLNSTHFVGSSIYGTQPNPFEASTPTVIRETDENLRVNSVTPVSFFDGGNLRYVLYVSRGGPTGAGNELRAFNPIRPGEFTDNLIASPGNVAAPLAGSFAPNRNGLLFWVNVTSPQFPVITGLPVLASLVPKVRLSATEYSQTEGNSGDTAFEVTVELSEPLDDTATVYVLPLPKSDANAANLADFAPAGTTSGVLVTFAAGETSKVVSLGNIKGDILFEADEHFSIVLKNPTFNVELDPTRTNADGIILNDDQKLSLSLTSAAAELHETGAPITLTLTLDDTLTTDLTVNLEFSGSATLDTDYTVPHSVVIHAGSKTAQFTITPHANPLSNLDKTITINPAANVSFNVATQPLTVQLRNDFIPPDALYDFGDAPDSYGTLAASGGARHVINSGVSIRLGKIVDSETDGFPAAAGAPATGDDTNALSDEDGIAFLTAMTTGLTAKIKAVAKFLGVTSAKLDAWIDFNHNGSFDPAEKIISSKSVANGDNTLSFKVPAGALAGNTYARFRITQNGIDLPTGIAPDGEVEDYRVTLKQGLPEISIVASDPTASEAGRDPGTFTVTRLGPTNKALTVPITLSGTAKNGTDFKTIKLSLKFAAGVSSVVVTINPTDDKTKEKTETIILTLQTGSGYTLGTSKKATVRLFDND